MVGVLLVRDYWLVIFVPWKEPNAEGRQQKECPSAPGDWGGLNDGVLAMTNWGEMRVAVVCCF